MGLGATMENGLGGHGFDCGNFRRARRSVFPERSACECLALSDAVRLVPLPVFFRTDSSRISDKGLGRGGSKADIVLTRARNP
jgi:hypothetical protein